MFERSYYVYILTNLPRKTVLYTGISNNLAKRGWQHSHGIGSRFAQKYNVSSLVYYEQCSDAESAIAREKQIKSGSRATKIKLIESLNPSWQDLSDAL